MQGLGQLGALVQGTVCRGVVAGHWEHWVWGHWKHWEHWYQALGALVQELLGHEACPCLG